MFVRYKGKGSGTAEDGGRWIRPALTIALAGSAAAGIVLYFMHQKDVAFGVAAGTVLSVVNFHFLYSLSGKILKSGNDGKKVFWFWSAVRWGLLALVCGALLWISPVCLWSALGGYFWGLLVLTWTGWRALLSSSRP